VQEACSLAKRCLRRARQRGASRHSAARIAATVLTRAAVDRGSRDNVTVVVVDLSRLVTYSPCCSALLSYAMLCCHMLPRNLSSWHSQCQQQQGLQLLCAWRGPFGEFGYLDKDRLL
jgi:serine/threonine protein phosphatase PrpC